MGHKHGHNHTHGANKKTLIYKFYDHYRLYDY